MAQIPVHARLNFYKRKDVQEAILACARDKEVAVRFGDNGFGRRPEVLGYASDVLEFAKKGATSFHCSEELWTNPMQIVTGMKRAELDSLRKGWDLVLDIDCKELEYSKLAADLIVRALKHHGISAVFVKFSGNHGFHIAVPFGSFPQVIHGKHTKDWFPEGPRKIALYLQEQIRPHLARRMLRSHDLDTISKRSGVAKSELVKRSRFDPFAALDIDTVLIASRHLYRMPYSFNEKSGLVSVPIAHDKILSFDRSWAQWDKVKVEVPFLKQDGFVENEARSLLIQAFDFAVKEDSPGAKAFEKKEFEIPQEALAPTLFPPCIKNILSGIKDGKKRAVFILMNFLRSCGWEYDQIEALLGEWNEKNEAVSEALRETNLLGPLRHHRQTGKKVLPPNCDNAAYYRAIGVCKPDSLCKRIKNPVSYARRRAFMVNLDKKDSSEKKEEPQAEQPGKPGVKDAKGSA